MEVRQFQDLMKRLYLEKDSRRGADKTFLWLVEEVGELSRELREGGKDNKDAIEEEIADIIAWVMSLSNLLDIDVEDALMKKYPGYCRYCGKSPCECEACEAMRGV